ncbi:MAG: hypothetical protein AAF680_07645, partial [Pseudomonadota bacterium]
DPWIGLEAFTPQARPIHLSQPGAALIETNARSLNRTSLSGLFKIRGTSELPRLFAKDRRFVEVLTGGGLLLLINQASLSKQR